MSDDYLWDGSGQVDSEVAELEELLSAYRFEQPAPEVPALKRFAPMLRIAAAALAVAAAVAIMVMPLDDSSPPPVSRTATPAPPSAPLSSARPAEVRRGWKVTATAGLPTCDGVPLDQRGGMLYEGEALDTDIGASAKIEVADIGSLEVAPNTQLILTQTDAQQHLVVLKRGMVHAIIDAPARRFVIEVLDGRVVDLGCAYTLTVDDDGRALLDVDEGAVALERPGRAALVPAGASCRTHPEGPGLPRFDDASRRFSLLADAFEAEGAEVVSQLLSSARRRDTLTLFHLLGRLEQPAQRERVYARMLSLGAPASKGGAEPIVALEPAALAAWRRQLEPAWRAAPQPAPEPVPEPADVWR